MPIHMPSDTRGVLGSNADRCTSRSLLLDRFVDPKAEKDDRKEVFNRAFRRAPETAKANVWLPFLKTLDPPVESPGAPPVQPSGILFAQTQARLLVNMAGSAMENAGLCLDRFGIPYIPGSAVKGCTRRAALAALRDWRETGQKPRLEDSNPLGKTCAAFATPEDLLTAIVRVFGWCKQDWSDKSDLAWAWGSSHETDRPTPPTKESAGAVSFLPAYPVPLGTTGRVEGLPLPLPELGHLELDVVTCHHREYYGGNPEFATAPDVEEPNPVFFPAVAPGHVFAFALVPLRSEGGPCVDHALNWLASGLAVFGLGAKTNAGYGWFADVTEPVQRACAAEARRRKAEVEKQENAARLQTARASLQPVPEFLEKLKGMKEADLRGQINAYAPEERFWTQPDERLQFTLLHFLLVESPKTFEADRGNPASKIAKALLRLRGKFPGVKSPEPPAPV